MCVLWGLCCVRCALCTRVVHCACVRVCMMYVYGVCVCLGAGGVCAVCIAHACLCGVRACAGAVCGPRLPPGSAGCASCPAPAARRPLPFPRAASPSGARSGCASLLWPQSCRPGAGQTCHPPGWPALQGLSRRPSPPLFNLLGSPVRPKRGSRC